MDRGDDHVGEGVFEVLERAAAGLAHGQPGFLDVLAGQAVLHEVGTGAVDVVVELQVFHRGLAGAAARTGMHERLLERLPVEGEHLDLVLVLGIQGLALDAVDLQKCLETCELPVLSLSASERCMDRGSRLEGNKYRSGLFP